jgi:hypothetical protein
MKHKWHKEIKAWADGAEIEYKYHLVNEWRDTVRPQWDDDGFEYRIKLQPKEPQYINVYGYLENQNVIFRQQIGMPYIGKIKLEVDDD